jgi:retron-type reverse transcriptase
MAGDNWVVDADIADFFGTLSQSTLVDLVAERVADGKVLRLVRQFLGSGVLRDGQFEQTTTGVPRGEWSVHCSPTSTCTSLT